MVNDALPLVTRSFDNRSEMINDECRGLHLKRDEVKDLREGIMRSTLGEEQRLLRNDDGGSKAIDGTAVGQVQSDFSIRRPKRERLAAVTSQA
jgi:hypothetical protein